MRRLCALACLVVGCGFSLGDEVFPRPGWKDEPNPLASPEARVGGEISVYAGQNPDSLNYYLANNTFSAQVFGSLYETLLGSDPITADLTPHLAEQWSISDDKLTFTFWLDPRARWSDGRPVTAEDVRWTFAAITNPLHLTGVHKVSLEKFEPPVVAGEREIRFRAREVHWRNLLACGQFHILPSHVYATQDFNRIHFEFPVVSGPYRLLEVKENTHVKLRRRDDWWGRALQRAANVGNFETVTYRFFQEPENAFEVFKKGGLDLFPVYMARIWVKETEGEKFQKNWIVKQKIVNHQPIGFQGFAMNMRRFPFDDLKVRMAMAHLLDRERMNETLMYGQYFMHRSYYEDLYSRERPCENPLFAFDKQRARELLREAGWKANPKTGMLEKDGRPFAFKFLTRDMSSDKFLAIYAEALKDVGIQMTIDRKDAAAWFKDMNRFDFDMTWAAWSGGLYKDPESMWASKEAQREGGNNITGFQNPQVDALIEQQRALFDVEARHAICRQIDALVARQVPYVLLWNINYVRLLYWNRFGMPRTVLSKFGDDSSAVDYWWEDEDSAADLAEAMKSGRPLPSRPFEVVFDDVFGR